MSKIFELVRPKSLQNADYADHEYLIRWIGRDGADYQLMFYDAEFERKTSGEVVNSESSTRIESLISSETRSVTLVANDLSRNDLDVVLQLFGNKFVTRLFKDGTTERFAPDSNSAKWQLSDGRYDIEIKLIQSNLPVWK
jgi:hypothetical protein